MCLARDNDVVRTLAPDRSDQPFGKSILPRWGRCNRFVPNAHGSQSACDDGAIDAIPVPDHVIRGTVPRKSLGELPCDPLRRRVGCDVDPDQVSAINPYNHEAIQQFEANGRGTTNRSMAAMSGAWFRRKVFHPLTRRPTSFHHVLDDG